MQFQFSTNELQKLITVGLTLCLYCLTSYPALAANVNVMNYGAKGNGSDDQAAIESAISAAGAGGSVYFPGGHNFGHSKAIVANSLTLYGDGATSILTALQGTAAVQLSGMGANVHSMAVRYLTAKLAMASLEANPANAGVAAVSAKNFTINAVNVSNTGGDAVNISQSSGGTVSNCNLGNNISGRAMIVLASSNVNITGNVLNDSTMGTLLQSGGMCSNLVFTGNDFKGSGFVSLSGVRSLQFNNNVLSAATYNFMINNPALSMSGNSYAGYLAIISCANLAMSKNSFLGSGLEIEASSPLSFSNNTIKNIKSKLGPL